MIFVSTNVYVLYTRHSISKDECEALIEAADADGDGNIDYEEFGNMLYARTQRVYNRHQRPTISNDQRSAVGPRIRKGSRIRKESVKKTMPRKSNPRARGTHVISREQRRVTTPSLLTTFVSILCLVFLIASLILLF